MPIKIVSLSVIFLLVITGCVSLEGTRDNSFTISKDFSNEKLDSIAILPIKDEAVIAGLSSMIEESLKNNLNINLPNTKIVDVQTFKQRLIIAKQVQNFGLWRAGYEGSDILETRLLPSFSHVVNARYFLLVRSIHFSQEKMRATDTGRTGWVSHADRVYTTNLKVSCELIDTEIGKVVWKGIGYAEDVNSPKDTDLFFVILHEKNDKTAEIPAFVDEMVQIASNGIATQIAGNAQYQGMQKSSIEDNREMKKRRDRNFFKD